LFLSSKRLGPEPSRIAASFIPDCFCFELRKAFAMLGTILIVILLLLLLGAWPAWPYSANWGYFPSGTLGLVLVIVLVLALLGRI
jgi:Protein of unknown function (DUF3309)